MSEPLGFPGNTTVYSRLWRAPCASLGSDRTENSIRNRSGTKLFRDLFQFCDKHGQNVRLANGKKTVLWAQSCFDGKCFISERLSKGGHFTLKLSGSGSILLGLADRRPKSDEIHDVENKLSSNCVYLQPYDMHKQRSFTVSLSRERSREIKVKGDNDRVLTINSGNIYVVLELLFGDLVVDLLADDGKKYKFDETCGPNIDLSRDFTTVCLKNAYSEAVCAAGRPLDKRETIHLIFNPVDEASWCHMTTYLSNKSPTMVDAHNMERGMRSRVKFKMRGSVQLCLQDDNVPCYTLNGQKKLADVRDLDITAPVYLYIQLFRVRVDLRSEPKPRTVSTNSSKCVKDGLDHGSILSGIPSESQRPAVDACTTGRRMTKKSFSDLIQSNRVYLKEFLDPHPLADHLVGDHKMSPTEAEKFQELRHRLEKCDMVLHILMMDPTTEGTFIKAMEYPEHPQKHILTKLGLLEGSTSAGSEA
ncbi:uncharacterized protein LOC124271660 isoform X2 [Haliotis rubra]|uniref:uncharacterized protein LOC124271660 isoform X2 n=1 Tax=Haliotis rubra TaxID=36100 RepID=UPI001EE5BD42|nr:uncharacterized protein LOC124271660 isoform X2 [Haliotis rubra]